MIDELGFSSPNPVPLMTDNQFCIKLVDNPVMHQRTKHIEIQAHFIREKVKQGDIEVNYIPTLVQQVDFLTKPLILF